MLKRNISAMEQYFSLTTFQYKPNFSISEQGGKLVMLMRAVTVAGIGTTAPVHSARRPQSTAPSATRPAGPPINRQPHAPRRPNRNPTAPRHATARVIRSGLQAWTAARARATSRLPLFTHAQAGARVGTTDTVLR